MVVDDTLSMRIYSFIDNILINKTIKQIKQKIDFIVFCVRHLGLIVTAVTINGFTPVIIKHDVVVKAFIFITFSYEKKKIIRPEWPAKDSCSNTIRKKFRPDKNPRPPENQMDRA